MSEARSVCAFPGWNLSFLNYILCVLCKTCAAVKRKPQTGEGPGPTPWSSHTCTEAKSPEAQAPRIAAPTRTDSTSCDRTTGMPAQDKATPWLGSRTGHCGEPASITSSKNTCCGGSSGHPLPVLHCSLFQEIPWVYRISLPLPAGTVGKGPTGDNAIQINSGDLFARVSRLLLAATCHLVQVQFNKHLSGALLGPWRTEMIWLCPIQFYN